MPATPTTSSNAWRRTIAGCTTRPTTSPTPPEFGAAPHPKGGFRFPDTQKERAYRAALKHWQNYQGWRANRHPERAALEAVYGYDTKHAATCCGCTAWASRSSASRSCACAGPTRPGCAWAPGGRYSVVVFGDQDNVTRPGVGQTCRGSRILSPEQLIELRRKLLVAKVHAVGFDVMPVGGTALREYMLPPGSDG